MIGLKIAKEQADAVAHNCLHPEERQAAFLSLIVDWNKREEFNIADLIKYIDETFL